MATVDFDALTATLSSGNLRKNIVHIGAAKATYTGTGGAEFTITETLPDRFLPNACMLLTDAIQYATDELVGTWTNLPLVISNANKSVAGKATATLTAGVWTVTFTSIVASTDGAGYVTLPTVWQGEAEIYTYQG